jgi:hypothetical protein
MEPGPSRALAYAMSPHLRCAKARRQARRILGQGWSPLVVAFSKLSVATSKGVPVFGKVTVSPADPRTLVATFARPLPAGDYEVHWKSVTADTHMMQGVYSLHVAP